MLFEHGPVIHANSALTWGGAERQLVNTVVGLSDKGIRELVVIREHPHIVRDNDFFIGHLHDAGVTVKDLQRELANQLDDELVHNLDRLLGNLQKYFDSLYEDVVFYALEFVRRRPSIVHAWQDQTSIKVGLAAVIAGVPKIILSTRNMAPCHFQYNQPYLKPAYRALLKRDDVTVVNNSYAGAADYARWLGVSADRFRVVHNGVDFGGLVKPDDPELAAYRREIGVPDGAPVVGAIFRFYNEKDPMVWVETAGQIAKARDDVVFVLIGSGPLLEAIRERAAAYNLDGRLFLPGTEKQPALAYGIMDVFLLTSRFEGLPNVVLESQSLGVPVVATDAGGTREAILEGKTGFVIDDRDPHELAEKVLFILDSPIWAEEARRLAPEFVRERFGLDRMIQETLDVYGWNEATGMQKHQGKA